MTFSSAVMCDQRLKCWNTIASFERRRCSCFGSAAFNAPFRSGTNCMTSPLSVMRPWLGCSSRLIQRNSVLFPEPLEPMMQVTSPALAASETPFSTSLLP